MFRQSENDPYSSCNPKEEQEELARFIPNSSILYLDEPYGHDAFLIDVQQVSRMVREFLDGRALQTYSAA